jgi:5-methylcytosine-specific restriction endonuclease McrA
MQKHTKIYYNHFGYSEDDFLPCEICGRTAVDIHHIIPRSKFGDKNKMAQDKIDNLMALCRECHDDAHREKISKENLFSIHYVYLIL